MRKTLLFTMLPLVMVAFSLSPALAQNTKPFALSYQSEVLGKGPDGVNATYSFKPLITNTDGSIKYECKLIAAILRNNGGTDKLTESFNSDSIKKGNLSYSSAIEKLAMLNKPFTIILNSKNIITAIDGLDAIMVDAKNKWQLKSIVTDQFTENKQELKDDLQKLFLKLPAKPIAFGSTWADGATQYKVKSIKGAILVMDVMADSASNGYRKVIKGNITYNEVTRIVESATLTTKVKLPEAIDRFHYHNNFTQQLVKNTHTVKVDTAWVNMAVKKSFWSNALMVNDRYDSAKVFSFFDAHNKSYGNDKDFQISRLDIIQQLDLKNDFLIYDSLLIKTPNSSVAASSTQLFNKMQKVMTVSVDTTLDLMRYYSKSPNFEHWIHYNFAVNFMFSGDGEIDYNAWKTSLAQRGLNAYQINKYVEGARREYKNKFIVLDSLAASKNLTYKQTATPLYLWLDAWRHRNDVAYLKTMADRFQRMDDVYMKKGYGLRYAISIYNMLLAKGEKKASAALLDHVNQKLTGYEADSVDANHYTYRVLLAHTYYLKAKEVQQADSVKWLKYLSSAAYYSPKTDVEKNGFKNADQYFLNIKDSYQSDLIGALLKNGKNDVAMQNIAMHIDQYPEAIDAMKDLMTTHFKDQDFKQFLANNVLAKWETAPHFKLANVDGKEHSLADYKGQWLIVDFWGTWCGPCQMDMPNVNTFNKDVAKGSYNGVQLLTIACNDTPEKVKAYFARTGYDFPVLMDDHTMSKDYQVKAVPRKIMISPDGKMKTITPGADWVGIMKKISQIYAAN
ncbi:TlpA family protein disulfide reductase [Mucilaginibacter sp. JRF]|uniref:DUF6263 family protein n=1 Tax=Mucilaginibacter sp. JRF TaxID=2780088 RepID=UPI001880F498|nr:DUF6263 family protein [Mucilaginibacter sp. JRF]MBE9585742.1 TlpA family protein disulfide reductase [Mucilaginibacter sp. JRF]